MRSTLTVILVLLLTSMARADSLVLKQSPWANSNLLQLLEDGDLEQVADNGFAGWLACQGGYKVDNRAVHGGQHGAVLRNTTPQGMSGLRHVVVRRPRSCHLTCRTWRRAAHRTLQMP